MKKALTTCTLALSFLTMMSCSKTPSACFTVDKGSGNTRINEEIQYNALCSTDTDSYTWDYGDGSANESGAQAKHKYRTAANYTVRLTAKNSSKDASTTQVVTIAP